MNRRQFLINLAVTAVFALLKTQARAISPTQPAMTMGWPVPWAIPWEIGPATAANGAKSATGRIFLPAVGK